MPATRDDGWVGDGTSCAMVGLENRLAELNAGKIQEEESMYSRGGIRTAT